MEIVLVRHGQSVANAAGRWQGQGDTPLTPAGRAQVERLAERLAGSEFRRVLSSDLGRTLQTAAALGREPEADSTWREIDVGAWEGLTRREVQEAFSDQIATLRAGEQVRLGGGETPEEFHQRVVEGLRDLAGGLDEGDRVLVVTHGGVVRAVVSHVLGLDPARRVLGPTTNTALTTVQGDGERWRVRTYNDVTHLGVLEGWAAERLAAGDALVSLIRHGRTEANRTGRWQGLADGPLDEVGAAQAQALAGWYGRLELLYASALVRARETAGVLAGPNTRVEEHPLLHEMSLGAWEDLTVEEIERGWANLWRRIYEEGEDLPRGESGEAFSQVASRMREALSELASRHAGTRLGVVSHAGAIRAYVGDLLDLEHRSRGRLAMPRNASVSHVVVGEDGPVLADYDLAPHLEEGAGS